MHFRRRPSALEGYDSQTGESVQAPLQDPTWGHKPPVSSEVRYTRTPDRVLKERLKQAAPQPVVTPVLDRKIEASPVETPGPATQSAAAVSRGDAVQRSASPQAPGVHYGRTPTRMSPQASARLRNETAPLKEQPAEPQPVTRTSNPLIVRKPEGQGAPVAAKTAPLELSTVQQSYSFLWQPGTYLIDPSLQSQPDAVIEKRAEAPTPPARKAVAERVITRPQPPAPVSRPEPVQIETAPWEDEPDDLEIAEEIEEENFFEAPLAAPPVKPTPRVASIKTAPTPANDSFGKTHASIPAGASFDFELPSLDLLAEPHEANSVEVPPEVLQENAAALENVLWDFNVKGEIINVHPGPVVTLYELEPAPGTKSSRVISLADDIARSMSAVSARVAVVQGRNAIGIELPNHKRETVYLRELLASQDFETSKQKLALCLGKTIGGEPVIADLARMPHLLVAGTTGSGKSVAINTMILSLVYRLTPAECRLIMVDPKMLELSVYDGIPHLLTPVVTDPKKAVVALKWAVREMEDRYRKMSKLGVRNIDGFNARVSEAKARGETITRTVQTGFDRETGEAIYEDEVMDLEPLPYIVVIVDEMADLMMVAGKEIEGAIQRLAQMARAAGIHVILATQRPSVDVITGTIKANFPTRISFQVTSKIDSRTILGEMGAEQLLGQGDMLYMAGGGRITRVHGPFCSDEEVEHVVAHLKRQGRPQYLEAVTADEEEAAAPDAAVFDQGEFGAPGGDLYDQAVAVVLRDKKASTSYIQRRLQIGYNRAASLMERMENEGIVGPANHAGKREILIDHLTLDD
jgi:DNA segregation ATPase FtsK/SpoIIIE, S-DNA-T family